MGALACPGCGSDDETGWNEDAEDEHLDLPGGGVERDGAESPRSRWVVGAGLVLVVVVVFLLARSVFRW